MTPERLGAKIDTLNSSIGDLRNEFASYCKRPASDSQHDRTSQALQAVVAGINVVTRTLQDQGRVPQIPAVAKSSPPAQYSDQEFERLVEEAMEGSTLGNGGKPLKTLDERRAERAKKAPNSTVTSTLAKHPEDISTKWNNPTINQTRWLYQNQSTQGINQAQDINQNRSTQGNHKTQDIYQIGNSEIIDQIEGFNQN